MPLCEGADVVAEHFVGAIHNDGDSREDEGIFGHGLTAGAANHELTYPNEPARQCLYFQSP